MILYYIRVLLFLNALCLLLPIPAHAAIQWSLSVVEGYYLPSLSELNYILKHREVELGPRNLEAKPVSYPVIYQGVSPEMPEMRPKSPKLGLQLDAEINPRYALVLGGSVAELSSVKRDTRDFFVGFMIPSNRETRFSLQLNQFWFGLKRYWSFGKKSEEGSQEPSSSSAGDKVSPSSSSPPAGEGHGGGVIGGGDAGREKPAARFYAEIGILAITRAYLTTDVWLHVYAPNEGFDFYKVTETGISGSGYATYLGGGGEYYLRRWLSMGIDVNYIVGGIGKLKYTHYFTVDPLEKDIIKRGDYVFYTDFIKGSVVPLFLDLEGWDFKGQVRLYF